MNTNDLKIFEAVADSGSFTKAAAAMFTVQSNVTARIKSLEEEFGAELFVRTSRSVELTSAGKAILPYFRKIGRLIEEAKQSAQTGDEVVGSLQIGCIETTMALRVPELLSRFEEQYPEVELEFQSGMRARLIDDVLSGQLDGAFVSAPVNVKGLDQLKISEEQLVLLTSAHGAQMKDLLSRQPVRIIVFAEGCVFRARLESWLSAKGIVHYKSTVLNSIEGIINFVEAGLGISLLPEDVISKYYQGRKIKTHTLNKQLGTMNTVFIYRKAEEKSKPLEVFMNMQGDIIKN